MLIQVASNSRAHINSRSNIRTFDMELKTYWSGGNCEREKVVNAKQPKEDHLHLLLLIVELASSFREDNKMSTFS